MPSANLEMETLKKKTRKTTFFVEIPKEIYLEIQ